MKKPLAAAAIGMVATLAVPAIAFAHVVVTPHQAGVGQELVFSVSVPNERRVAVRSIKLEVPKGVEEVTPTVTPGWTIATVSSGGTITAITWMGTIPVGQREDFSFGAQVPATATQLDWKAYQTYADGTVVHWDQTPAGSDDAKGTAGPYSVTQVVDDLGLDAPNSVGADKNTLALVFSAGALALSAGGLFIRRRR